MELNFSLAEANKTNSANEGKRSLGTRTGRVTRILVADDHESVRRGIGELIKSAPGFELSGEAASGIEVVEKARRIRPDIVILDMSMPEMNGLEAARQIIREMPSTEVMILTVNDSEQLIQEVLAAGVHGYMLKSDIARDLQIAIGSLSQGRPFFTAKVAKMVLDGYLASMARTVGSCPDLTSREREVIQLLAEGKSSKEVAVIQGIAVKTAETHRTNLMRKLRLHSICDLVHYAVRNQIIDA